MRLTAIILALTLASFPAETSKALERSEGETCMTEEGPAQWTGECKDELAQGEGVATYTDSYIQSIEGRMVDGVPRGKVTITFSGGGYYSGGVLNGEPHGYGTNMEAWGEGYTGNWNNGFRDGEGVYVSSDGTRTPGVWRRGRLIGSWYSNPSSGCEFWWRAESDPVGEATWSGACNDGKAAGDGKIIWHSDDDGSPTSHKIIFKGTLVRGVIQGDGEWQKLDHYVNVKNETTYSGAWLDGERNGRGKQLHTSDSNESYPFLSVFTSYVGDWRYDTYWGKGRYEKKHRGGREYNLSMTEEGEYVAGRLRGKGRRVEIRVLPNDSKITEITEGEFLDGVLGGSGSKTYESIAEGKRLYQEVEGDWSPNGQLEGIALYYDGSKFEGKFSKNWTPLPFSGRCIIPKKNFSGPCKIFHRQTSEFSGETCLVPENETEPCLIVISSWVE